MKKLLLVLLASTALVVSHTACTSSDSSGETGEQIASEGGDNPEAVSDGTDALVGDATGAADVGSAETLAEGNLSDPGAPADPAMDPNASPETAVVDQNQQMDANGNPVDPNAQAQTSPPAATDTLTSTSTPISDTKPTETVTPSITETPPPPAEAKPVVQAEYQKMKDTTWVVNKKVVNTVYFARPGDTLKSISQKIYGDETHEKELKKINMTLKSRSVRVGDKVYYNSPNRPEDSTKLMTYFEDKGITPQVYTAKEGDKVKTVSKELLGFDSAWKEVWGSNSFDSKKTLEPGTEIKYWKEDTAPTVLASTETPPTPDVVPPPPDTSMPPPPPDMGSTPPPPPDVAVTPPPPPPDMTMPPPPPDISMNPPPPPPDMAPPPPPDMGSTPPPPPDMNSPATTAPAGSDEMIAGMDQETIMIVGIGAAALLLAVIFIVKRKNRQRQEFEQAMNETQVG